jgi:hypothetical protein
MLESDCCATEPQHNAPHCELGACIAFMHLRSASIIFSWDNLIPLHGLLDLLINLTYIHSRAHTQTHRDTQTDTLTTAHSPRSHTTHTRTRTLLWMSSRAALYQWVYYIAVYCTFEATVARSYNDIYLSCILIHIWPGLLCLVRSGLCLWHKLHTYVKLTITIKLLKGGRVLQRLTK